MADSDIRGNNRFLDTKSTEETVNKVNPKDMLLNIMKDEFPDDIYYRQGILSESPAKQAMNAFKPIKGKNGQLESRSFPPAGRNDKNVLDLSVVRNEYVDYEMSKSFPTIDEDALDELIDEEWDYFEDPEAPDSEPIVIVQEPKPTGLFLVNSEADMNDYHDMYLKYGPQTIDPEDDDITSRVFCVFFIHNGVARPIPTYKTLEVMLVEQGKTYEAIAEATAEEIAEFDLLIDGNINPEDDEDPDYVDGLNLENEDPADANDDNEMTPYEEFLIRSMPLRDPDWNYVVRFKSGYRPAMPFLRDPGDYVKPENMRATDGRIPVDEDGVELPPDVFGEEDPTDMYFDQVFQKQTYREKLREKYEGKMVIADWPSPEYDAASVDNQAGIASDDAVLNLRIMINGHWKRVTDGRVMKLYAYLYDYDISNYAPANAGRYGPTGYIQLLIDAGGVTVVQPNNGQDLVNDDLTGNSDMARDIEPLWNAFPHIVEADDDGRPGVDFPEYQEYLDNFSNGQEPFAIEHLIPFEPPGSIHYYPKQNYQALIQQALEQEQIDQIKDQIFEIWPTLASQIQNVKNQFESLPPNLGDYVVKELGPKSPLYKLWISKKGKWKYVKKKTLGKDRIKTKKSNNRLFKICSKTLRIKMNLNERQERDLVRKYKWMKTVQRDKFAAWMSGGARAGVMVGAPVAAGAGVKIFTSIKVATAAAKAAAWEAAFVSAGGYLGPTITVSAAGPTFGATLGALATNPITIGAAVIAGTFLLVDKLVGEVPADKYDLPPWRFVDDNWYLKACITNEIDDDLEGFKQAADAADVSLEWCQDIVMDLYEKMGEIDNLLLEADEVEEFQDIYDFLLATQSLLDSLNDSGLFAQALNLRKAIDDFVKDHLKRQYKAIQYLRKKVHRKIGRKRKFGLVWPQGPQNILNAYVPGCKFDNHVPKV